MPSCGHPPATDPPPQFLLRLWLPLSMELIHQQIVSPSPCSLAACVMLSSEVLSAAPGISRKAPSVTHQLPCFQGALWFQWTSLVGRHIGIYVGDITAKFCTLICLFTYFPPFSTWRTILRTFKLLAHYIPFGH